MRASRNQSGEVRHVDHEEGADLVGNRAHAGEVDDARIRAATADNQLGMLALGDLLELVVVDGFGILGDAVGNNPICLAGKVKLMPMREVAAMREVQAEDRVARLEHRAEASMLAVDPECGCTLACSAPKSCLARSRARFSTTSANSHRRSSAFPDSLPRTCW